MNNPGRFHRLFRFQPVLWTAVYALVWLAATADWLWFRVVRAVFETMAGWAGSVSWLGWLALSLDWLATSSLLHWLVFVPAVGVAGAWVTWSRSSGREREVRHYGIATGAYVVAWQFAVFASYELGWDVVNTQLARLGTVILFLVGLLWVVWGIERASQYFERVIPPDENIDLGNQLRTLFLVIVFLPPLVLLWGRRRQYPLRCFALGLLPLGLSHMLLLPYWIDAATGLSRWSFGIGAGQKLYPVGDYLDWFTAGWLYIIPLVWLVASPLTWWAWRWDRQRCLFVDEQRGFLPGTGNGWWHNDINAPRYNWSPLDQNAWYYGRHSQKLNQSVTALIGYSFSFTAVFLLFGQIGGCSEIYEMPAGGGEQQQIAQLVKVQKVIKRKYVINPFSAILFQVPPIDDIKLQLTELTHHAYKVGYGEGQGAGYAGGTQRGKVRFIRLEYSGGDWDQDFGVGADLNMLIEYNVRTQQKVHNKTESRTVGQLKNFPVGKSPPMVYLTGQKSISLSKNEIGILREFLLEKHGMVFGDNGGSGHFHNQFLSMMRRVLPTVDPVPVPLDDVIHRIPYQVPFLPYVAPHGGQVALGWKVDGRWVCYYHPGDIGDAWADGHAGVKPEIYEYCYQLGTNVINYAHAEYSKWLEARKEKK